MNSRNYTILSILVLFFLSALIMLRQLTSTDFFSCFISDTFTYTSWASQFIDALKEGIIYPLWTPINFWGYGNPTFVIYGPLAFYMVAMFHIFSDSLIFAMKLAKFLSLFVTASGIFFLIRIIMTNRIYFRSSLYFSPSVSLIYIGGSFLLQFP
jgi:uncharacterized membrane protein